MATVNLIMNTSLISYGNKNRHSELKLITMLVGLQQGVCSTIYMTVCWHKDTLDTQRTVHSSNVISRMAQ